MNSYNMFDPKVQENGNQVIHAMQLGEEECEIFEPTLLECNAF